MVDTEQPCEQDAEYYEMWEESPAELPNTEIARANTLLHIMNQDRKLYTKEAMDMQEK